MLERENTSDLQRGSVRKMISKTKPGLAEVCTPLMVLYDHNGLRTQKSATVSDVTNKE